MASPRRQPSPIRDDLPLREPTPDSANRIDATPSLENKRAGAGREVSNVEQRTDWTPDTLEGVVTVEIPSKGSGSSSPRNQGDEAPQSEELSVLLWHRDASDEPLRWRASIRSNPHLMILGLVRLNEPELHHRNLNLALLREATAMRLRSLAPDSSCPSKP